MRQRSVDLQGLLGLALCGLRFHETPRAGVVQPVGELDDEHADVLRHRDDHLAHRLRLRAVAVLQLVELGDAVDEHRDLVAEVGPHHVERVVGVLDRVVQHRGGERLRADAEVGEDLGDRDRVGDVRLAALAQLTRVRLVSGRVGPLDEGDIGLGVMLAHRLEQAVDRAGGLGTREEPRQDGAQRGGVRRLCIGHDHLPLSLLKSTRGMHGGSAGSL